MSTTEKDELIGAAYERLDGALAPPLDGVDRIERRVAARRRHRRTARAGLAAVVVVGVTGGVALARSGDDPDGTTAVDQPSGPQSTLVLTRPDGSTYAFDDVTISCEPPKLAGEPTENPPGRIWMYSPITVDGQGDDARATAPFVYFEGVLSQLATDTTYDLPFDAVSGDSDDRAFVLFVADSVGEKRGNEVSSAEPGAAGTVRVVRAACDPVPVLELEVDSTLGSEVEQGTLDVAGVLR